MVVGYPPFFSDDA